HVSVRGENTHHMIEAIFKGAGRALRPALEKQGHQMPSTKGVL
ncbi:MAG: bifunctional histidinol-phosphatase/imidazoleglycerol-phosphate dehydratase, partial [Gammaproteobacteria bacterium]|nr:bifunctional histidinol-phosphatase/imidazoleglycerol-phosphate dehydratase [Gammaproteobacteria bacterium]